MKKKNNRANGPKALWSDPDKRESVLSAIHERSNDPEYIDEQQIISRLMWCDPEYIKKQQIANEKKHIQSEKRLAKLRAQTLERKENKRMQKEKEEQQYKDMSKKHGIIQRVRCVTNNTMYVSASKAEKALGLSVGSVSRCCRGYYKNIKGYVFEYA